MPKLSPFLWFDTQAEEAANFYVSIFKNSKILNISRCGEGGPGPAGTVLTVHFELDGQVVHALNGGPRYKFTEAISLLVPCDSQEEIDYFWEKLASGGGKEIECGWVKDKFGLCWQVVPSKMAQYMTNPDATKAKRCMEAMMQMKKLDMTKFEAIINGN